MLTIREATVRDAEAIARVHVSMVGPADERGGLYERLGFVITGSTATHTLMVWSPT
jgi:hypothetical protein